MRLTKVVSAAAGNEAPETPALRMPTQQRSQQRVESALAVAEQMVKEFGPEQLSIPEVAKAANVPRASLYQFFPDKYALLARLAELHMARLTELVAERACSHDTGSYHAWIASLVDAASDYYDANPVASILVLGGPHSHAAYLAQESMSATIGGVLRSATESRLPGVRIPRSPDISTLAVEIGFACMKHGYYRDGSITSVIRAQAVTAVIAYVEACVPGLSKAFRAWREI